MYSSSVTKGSVGIQDILTSLVIKEQARSSATSGRRLGFQVTLLLCDSIPHRTPDPAIITTVVMSV